MHNLVPPKRGLNESVARGCNVATVKHVAQQYSLNRKTVQEIHKPVSSSICPDENFLMYIIASLETAGTLGAFCVLIMPSQIGYEPYLA